MTVTWYSPAQPLWQKVIMIKKINILKLTIHNAVDGVSSGRSRSSRRDGKLPTLAQVNREISDKSAELVGQKGLEPRQLVEWISDKRGRELSQSVQQPSLLHRKTLLYLHEVRRGEVLALLAPVQVRGDGQQCHQVQADLLHTQPGRPDTVCSGQHDLHRSQQVRLTGQASHV